MNLTWQPLHLVNFSDLFCTNPSPAREHACENMSFGFIYPSPPPLLLLSPYITMWRLVDHSVPAAGSCTSTRSHGHICLWLIAQCKQQQPCRDSLSQHVSYLVSGSKQFPSQCPIWLCCSSRGGEISHAYTLQISKNTNHTYPTNVYTYIHFLFLTHSFKCSLQKQTCTHLSPWQLGRLCISCLPFQTGFRD